MDQSLEKKNHYNFLYSFYSPLLTKKQCEVFENYYFEDYSLSEISESLGVSRNAIWDLLKKVEHNLDEYEEKLGLFKKVSLQFTYGLKNLHFYGKAIELITPYCQNIYYTRRLEEIKKRKK